MADFGQFQEQGFDLTQKEVKKLEKEIIASYNDAQKELERLLEKTYSKLAGIDPADGGYYNELLKRDRYTAMLKESREIYSRYLNKSNTLTVSFI